MKAYFKRLTDACPKHNFIIWWVFRLLMVYAFVAGFFKTPFDITDPLQVAANLLCMFVWEIFMMFPEKSVFRHVTPGFQTFLIAGIFAASFGGKFMNFYYDIRWWDSVLHFIGGAGGVFYGYELVCALMKKEKKNASIAMVLLASVGFSFIASTLWELFEFSFDQVAGMMSGYPGDSQHWSFELALGTPKLETLFDPIVPERWPIMDIMADIVLNTLGAAASYVILKIYPYRHKGKYKFDLDFENKEAVSVS
ncbi:MAG: hypothetical protein IJ491_02935 [Clostridia bacterium]|nr:hypothetical protein [Clostridia bacterium]